MIQIMISVVDEQLVRDHYQPPRGIVIGPELPQTLISGPAKAQYQVKVCCNHDYIPVGPIGGRWDQIWPPWGQPRTPGPPEGYFGSKTSPFGGPKSGLEVS